MSINVRSHAFPKTSFAAGPAAPDTALPNALVPVWVGKGRVPCLDGLRAFALAAVIDSHLNLRQNVGHLGVTLFFVISGFLITLLMLREQSRTGTLSLPDFYRRRTLRIMPALLFFLFVVFLLQIFGLVNILARYWVAALTYTMCYANFNHVPDGMAWDIEHTWSLSVEEHFYLLWPLLFYFAKPAKAFKGLVVYLLMVPLLRILIFAYFRNTIDITTASITEMGSIGMGCVAAFIAQGQHLKNLSEKMRRHPAFLLVTGILLVAAQIVLGSEKFQTGRFGSIGRFDNLFGDPISSLGFALLLLWAVHVSQTSMPFRILNFRPLVILGTLSYSLYLWQQLFTRFGVFSPDHRPGIWGSKIVTLLLIAACALVSYYAVEVPFLRIKDKKTKILPVASV